jgi:probable blue pigment (indigoidine) exporter
VRRLPRGQWWWRSAVLGTLNIGAFFALLFISAYRLPGGVAAVLGAMSPLVVAGLTVGVLRERVARRTVVAALVGASGVGLTVITAEARLDLLGVLAGVGGAASMALGIVLTKRWARPASLLTMTSWQLTAGGLVLLPLALLVEGVPPTLTGTHVGGYAYLSLIGSALAYTLWFRGLDRLPAPSVSMLGQLSPVVATIIGWVLLEQALRPLQLLGMALALGAVVVGSTAGRQVRAGRRRPDPELRVRGDDVRPLPPPRVPDSFISSSPDSTSELVTATTTGSPYPSR